MPRTNDFTEVLVDWVDGRLRQTRFSNLWLGGGAGPEGGSSYRPIDGQLTQRHVSYDTSEPASPCAPSGFSSLVDNLRRMRYWQEPATWFGVETTSGLRVTIKPGLWYPSTTSYCAFAGGDTPTFTLPGVLDRIDTVYVDSNGILHIQRGTPDATPTITLPPIASGIPLWAVYLTPTTSGIYFPSCSGYYAGQGYIERDLRPFLNLGGTGAAASGVPNATAEGQALISDAALEWTADTTPLWKGEHSFEAGISVLTGQGITMADETWIGIGVANERIIFDTAGDICVMGANFGIGVNPPDMDLHVHGANSVTIKLTNDDTGISGNVGLDIGVGTSEQAYMWNRENTELSFGTNNLRRMTILANGKIGINAATIPYGGVGAAMLALHGTDVSADGPHIQITTDNDDYPLLQVLADKHDNVRIAFDAYYDYASWKSSDLGSNCVLYKESDYLHISYDSNVGQGNNITWNTGLVMNLSLGHIGIATDTPGGKLDIAWGGTGTYMTLQLGADSSNSTRTNVTNKYVHMGAYHYTNIEEPIGMMYVASTSLVSRLDIGGGSGFLNAATRVSIYAAANTTTTTGTEILKVTSSYFLIDPGATGVKAGIGTATPQSTEHLHASGSGANYMQVTNATTGSGAGDGSLFGIGAGEDTIIWNYETEDIIFGPGNAEAVRMLANGRVGIGTASPLQLYHQQGTSIGLDIAELIAVTDTVLLVEGTDAWIEMVGDDDGTWCDGFAFTELSSGALTGKWGLVRQTTGAGNGSFHISYGVNANPWANTSHLILGIGGGVTIAGLGGGGNQDVGADNTGLLYVPFVSDRKFKNNIEPLTGGLNVIKALRGVTFDWSAKALADVGLDFGECGQQVGLIAQEVVEFIPQAGSDGKQYKSYQKSMITPYLIEAIKEISIRLDILESK